jgi:tRNA G18 (ribose-2'-O)-methylase SpoU
VRRALQSPRIRVRSLLLNSAAANGLADAIEAADPSIDVYVAAPDVMTAATGFNMHRGCLALAERPAAVSLESVLATNRFVAVLERVIDPDNVGSVFRACEAFGVDAVLLSPGCADPFYRKAIRTSSGAALVVPFAEAGPWPDALDRLRAAGFVTVAMTPDDQAVDIAAFAGTGAALGRVAVVFGTEGQGLTADTRGRVDVCVRIPMTGALDSLNVATAAGIALHRLHEVRARA